jgi:Methyltransferase domain
MTHPANFDRLVHVYRWMEFATFGRLLRRCRCRFLDQLGGCRAALVLGDGDGRFTARLLAANPRIRVDAVDASQAMLEALLRRVGPHRDRVRTHLADARGWSPCNGTYDLIVTHFFLDCLTTEEVAALAARLRPCATDQARWVVSEFAVPPRGFGRIIARPIVAGLYWAFGLLTGLEVRRLPAHRAALLEEGFSLQREQCSAAGLLVSEMWLVGSRTRAGNVARPERIVTSVLKSSSIVGRLMPFG